MNRWGFRGSQPVTAGRPAIKPSPRLSRSPGATESRSNTLCCSQALSNGSFRVIVMETPIPARIDGGLVSTVLNAGPAISLPVARSRAPA